MVKRQRDPGRVEAIPCDQPADMKLFAVSPWLVALLDWLLRLNLKFAVGNQSRRPVASGPGTGLRHLLWIVARSPRRLPWQKAGKSRPLSNMCERRPIDGTGTRWWRGLRWSGLVGPWNAKDAWIQSCKAQDPGQGLRVLRAKGGWGGQRGIRRTVLSCRRPSVNGA